MKYNEDFENLFQVAAAQVNAYERRAASSEERQYCDVMRWSTDMLARFVGNASFDELIRAEKMFQKNDITIYAQRPATMKSVQEGIEDLEEGEAACKQLLENTEAYKAHGYRKKERLAPEKIIPLDAMRRALRGQMRRVENYRANVMGNAEEQEFMSARIALLRRAETLYDAMQRERLLPQ